MYPNAIRIPGEEPPLVSETTEGSQQVIVLEAEVNLTRKMWQKHPLVTGLKAAVSFAMASSEQDTPGIQKGLGVMPFEGHRPQLLLSQGASGNIAPAKAPWFP